MAEMDPGNRIDAQITRQMLGVDNDPSLYGLAVVAEKMNPDVAGIARTMQLPRTSILQTDLSHGYPKNTAQGSIFAFDAEHNTLWLRPQRLTIASIDAGFLAVTGFVQNFRAAYRVTVREPVWRDGMPRADRYRSAQGGIPEIPDYQWERLNAKP